MQVKILTYHFSDNYGALFQAYGLREWFRRRGVNAEFINYHPKYVEEGGRFDQPLNFRKWKKNMTIAYMKGAHVYWSLFGNPQQRKAFDEFRRAHLGIVGPRLLDSAELTDSNDGDLLVCGSDQIWNPSIQRGLDPVYFLNFNGATRARRVAYAPSFGKASLPAEFHAEAGKLISGLNGISVREDSGVKIVRDVSGREATCVPDPTILLGDFANLLETIAPPSEKHVFCYALRTSEVIREVAEHAARVECAKLLSPRSARQRWKAIGAGIEPGPVEWLRLLDSSSLVVTNSFHGVALSIVLNKRFLAVALPGKKSVMNERVRNLLDQTALLDRIVTSTDANEIERVMCQPIDWTVVNERVKALRRTGEDFLDDQISSLSRMINV